MIILHITSLNKKVCKDVNKNLEQIMTTLLCFSYIIAIIALIFKIKNRLIQMIDFNSMTTFTKLVMEKRSGGKI